jgi:predicted transposase/invertase (TIGR01784 family)
MLKSPPNSTHSIINVKKEHPMGRYLNPKSDLVFKKIFGEHPDLLKSFLNAFLPLEPDRQVEHIDYLPTESVPEIPSFKSTIVDVRCTDTLGRHFIVEMQLRWTDSFMKRMLFNSASAYMRQLKKGETYGTLCPVYGLSIVDAHFSEGTDWFHHYRLAHTKDASNTLDDIQLIFLELPKFKASSVTEKKLTILWLRFLTEINEDTETVDAALFEIPEISKALECSEIAAYTPGELRAYDANWDAVSTEKTLLTDNFKAGKAEGINEGRQKEQHKIAQNSLAKGLDIQTVSDITGLSLEILEEIQAKHPSE